MHNIDFFLLGLPSFLLCACCVMGLGTGMMGMMGMGGMDLGMATALADAQKVDWMFPPPEKVMFHGSFAEAREACKAHGRWLLVNIQRVTEFASHQLNRDTWSNETVETLLSSQLLLWQQHEKSAEGARYCKNYELAEHARPHIAIVDPRTSQKIKEWTGFVDAQDLVAELLAFCASAPPLDSDTPVTPSDRERSPSAGAGANSSVGGGGGSRGDGESSSSSSGGGESSSRRDVEPSRRQL